MFDRIFSWIALSACSLVLSGCVSYRGAENISPSGYAYNQAIAQSKSEQLLLNLVRLKYRDAVVFMDIDGITTQHQYAASFSAETLLPFRRASNGSTLLTPGLGVSETPTIVFKPLDSSQFAQDLLAPITPETIVLLANSGWSIERLFTCCVERLGSLSNAPSASGPTPETLPDNSEFRAVGKRLRALQTREKVRVELIPDPETQIASTFLLVDARETAECMDLRKLLGVDTCDMRFRLVAKGGVLSDGDYFAQTRTVLGALYTLSHGVDIPPQHVSAALTTQSRTVSEGTTNWHDFLSQQFHVRVGKVEPQAAAVKVGYRDHWYWIADDDLESKTTFNLMLFLLALQSAASDGASPLLTINAGG
jgi:hypothetical protein